MTQGNITNTPSKFRGRCTCWRQIISYDPRYQLLKGVLCFICFVDGEFLLSRTKWSARSRDFNANPLTPGPKLLDSFNFRAALLQVHTGGALSHTTGLEKGKSALIPGNHLGYARGQHPKWLQACYHCPCNCFCCLFFKTVFLCGIPLAVLTL